MNSLDRLCDVTLRAQQQDDLPDMLAVRIFAIVNLLQGRSILRDKVEELIEQVQLYDTYGQTGYIGMGVSNIILDATLRRFEQALEQHLGRNPG